MQKSVEALCSIGKIGLIELTKRPSKLSESLKRANKSYKLIRILKRIPDFQWTSELQKAIAQAISRSRSQVYYIINEVNSVSQLTNSEEIIEGLLTRIKRISQYHWRQWEFRRLLRGGSVPHFLANAIRTSKYSQRILQLVSKCTELSTLPEIKSAIEYVTKKDEFPKSSLAKPIESLNHIIVKRKQYSKQPSTMQQSLAIYIDKLIKQNEESI